MPIFGHPYWILIIRKFVSNSNFFELGGHSLLLTVLLKEIRQTFECSISIADIYQDQTIKHIAERISQNVSSNRNIETNTGSSIIKLKSGNVDTPPIFLIHPVGGGISCYLEFVKSLDTDGEIYGIQRSDLSVLTIEELSKIYLSEIAELRGSQLIHIVGWSMGGVIGYEMARQLESIGRSPASLTLIDSVNPAGRQKLLNQKKISQWRVSRQLIATLIAELGINVSRKHIAEARNSTDALLFKVLELGLSQSIFPSGFTIEELTKQFDILKENSHLLNLYEPEYYGGEVHLIRASDGVSRRPDAGWGTVVKRLDEFTIQGDHYSLVKGKAIEKIADLWSERRMENRN